MTKRFDQIKAEHWLLVIDNQLLIWRSVDLCKTHPVVDVIEPWLIQMSCEIKPWFDRLVERSNVFLKINEEEGAMSK